MPVGQLETEDITKLGRIEEELSGRLAAEDRRELARH